jgi:hypothetical protein
MNMKGYPTLHLDINSSKEQLLVRKDMNVNEQKMVLTKRLFFIILMVGAIGFV